MKKKRILLITLIFALLICFFCFLPKEKSVSKKIKIQEQKNEEKIVQTEKIDKEIELLLEENRVLKNQINVLEEQLNYFEIFKIVFGLLLIVLIFIILKRVKS